MNTEHEDKELQRLAPTLHEMKGRDPIVVPDDFFAHFPHAVQAMAVASEKHPVPAVRWMRRMAWALPVAALLVLAVFLVQRPAPAPDPTNNMLAEEAAWWDLFEEDLLHEALYTDADLPHTVELDDDDWLAYWEDQGLLDLYMDQYPR